MTTLVIAGSSSCQRRSLGRVWGLWEVGKISPRWPPACASRRWGWRQWGFWKWSHCTWNLCVRWLKMMNHQWWCWRRRFFEEDLKIPLQVEERVREAVGKNLSRCWNQVDDDVVIIIIFSIIITIIITIIISIIITIIINRQGSLRRGTNGTTSIPITLSVSLQELRAQQ